jgi:2'-5' RNA ligase
MDDIRCFLALELGAFFTEELQVLIQKMKNNAPSGAKWVEPAAAHLTLHFFGSLDRESVDSVIAEFGPRLTACRPFDLYLKGTGCFPNARAPRVLWAGIEGDLGRLSDLKATVDEAVKTLGLQAEEREFKPHLTLARLRNPAPAGDTLRAGTGFLTRRAYRVDHATLFRSDLQSSGPRYTPLCRFDFEKSAA